MIFHSDSQRKGTNLGLKHQANLSRTAESFEHQKRYCQKQSLSEKLDPDVKGKCETPLQYM